MTAKYSLPNLFSFFLKAAESGERYAMWKVACCYFEGRFVEKDYKEAARWHEKSATLGYLLSQRALADMLQNGIGCTVNHTAAFNLYKKAADQGDPISQYEYGRHLLFLNDELSIQVGLNCLEKSSMTSCSESMFLLNYFRAMNQVPPRSKQEALTRLLHAGSAGNVQALYTAGLIKKSDFYRQDEAREFFKRAADMGHTLSKLELASILMSTTNPNDKMVASTILLELAQLESAPAQFSIGMAYLNGTGCPKNEEQALYWLEKASSMASGAALFQRAEMILNKENATAEDVQRAIKLHEQAIANGHLNSLYYLGFIPVVNQLELYLEPDERVRLLKIGAEVGNTKAMIELAYLYNHNDDLFDNNRGMFWLAAAADEHNAQAQFILGDDLLKRKSKHHATGLQFMSNASALGYNYATYQLGKIFYWGKASNIRNKKVAAEYFLTSAEKGCIPAMNDIGCMLAYGDGVTQKVDEGQRWLQKYDEAMAGDGSDGNDKGSTVSNLSDNPSNVIQLKRRT